MQREASVRTHYEAICYRCSHRAGPDESVCPACAFPLILQSERRGSSHSRLKTILGRSSVSSGAFPLPGVPPSTAPEASASAAREVPRTARSLAPAMHRSRPWAETGAAAALRVALVCCSAVAAGVLAAVIKGGL